MKKFLLCYFFIFYGCQLITAHALALPVYEIKSDTIERQELGNMYWQMLEDKKGEWTIEDVSNGYLSKKFHATILTQPRNDTYIKTYWFRYKLKNLTGHQAKIALSALSEEVTYFIMKPSGEWKQLNSGLLTNWEKKDGLKAANCIPIILEEGEEILLYKCINNYYFGYGLRFDIAIVNSDKQIRLIYDKLIETKSALFSLNEIREAFFIGFLFFAVFFNFFYYLITKEKHYLYFTSFVFFFIINRFRPIGFNILYWGNAEIYNLVSFSKYSWSLTWISLFLFFQQTLQIKKKYSRWYKILVVLFSIFGLIAFLRILVDIFHLIEYNDALMLSFLIIEFLSMVAIFATLILFLFNRDHFTKRVIIGSMPLIFTWVIITQFSSNSVFNSVLNFPDLKNWLDTNIPTIELITSVWFVLFFSWFLFRRYNQLKIENAQQAIDKEILAKQKEVERNQLIEAKKIELEEQIKVRTAELTQSLQELKSTQSQLIQSEKMASLGELTSGIAHEIQNPLNFVNNFSELSNELIDEMNSELGKGDILEARLIATDIKHNLEKINHHGKRADAIVKGMLQHSRSSSGQKETTDINALCDEYLRLSYHGLRAKDKSFNATLKTDFDERIVSINIVPQDIGRVVLNLLTNAFYAVNERKGSLPASDSAASYIPTVSISTKKSGNHIEIKIQDNGNGIPRSIIDKIFQPFFTTKPTGQGTGLGLSLSYDIITKGHAGTLEVESEEGAGSVFTIRI